MSGRNSAGLRTTKTQIEPARATVIATATATATATVTATMTAIAIVGNLRYELL